MKTKETRELLEYLFSLGDDNRTKIKSILDKSDESFGPTEEELKKAEEDLIDYKKRNNIK